VRRLVICFAVVFCFARCGTTVESVVVENLLVDEILMLNRSSFLSYPFTIDFSFMSAPRILAGFSSDEGTTLLQILVLTEGNYILWESGEAYTAAVESPLLAGTSFEWDIPSNGGYRVVISNRGDSLTDKQVAVFATVFWQPAE
jgi:hypothetical protein